MVDIIGLDYNQFSQIAMIAQGQFTRLLNASTEERSKIFRKLFRTQPYQRLQERLQAENAALTRQREEQSVRIGQLLSGLSWAEGDADEAVLDELAPLCEAGGQASPEAVLPLLDALLAGQEQALSAATAARTEAEAELDKLQQTLGRAEQAEKLRLELTAAQARQDAATPEMPPRWTRWPESSSVRNPTLRPSTGWTASKRSFLPPGTPPPSRTPELKSAAPPSGS